MKVQTGDKKTPDGFYVVVVEGSPNELQQVISQVERGARVELAGTKLLIYVRSRKLRNKLYRRLIQYQDRGR